MSAFPSPSFRFIQKDGIIYFYDRCRSKWLSVCKEFIFFNINHNNLQTNQWLSQNGVTSNIQGYFISRNSTITSISFQCNNYSCGKFKIFDDSLNIFDMTFINEKQKIINNLNIDINSNHSIKALLEIKNNTVNFPTLKIELSWRKD